MSKSLDKIKEMVCKELDDIASRGELTAGSLDTVDKLTHSLKSIVTIKSMEDGGYSNDVYPHVRRYDGYSRDTGRAVEKLRMMLEDVSNDNDRRAIRECINKMEG